MKKNYFNFLGTLMFLLLSVGLFAQAPVVINVNSPNQFSIGDDEIGQTVDFGPNIADVAPITGDLEWARDNGIYDGDADGMPDPDYTDSLNCSWETTMDNVDGKIALVRRGACFFSQKIYNAQLAGAIAVIICNNNADDPDEIIGMLGIDSAAAVVIPSVFISYNNCQALDMMLQDGETVNLTITTEVFYNPYGAYTYHTPEAHLRSLDHIGAQIVNADSSAANGVELTVTVDEPGGSTTTLTNTVDISPLADTIVLVPSYTPNAGQGEYTLTYTTSLHPGEELQTKFNVTEYTWGTDDGVVTGDVGPGDELFFDSDYLYETGSLVLTGDADPASSVATHFSFGIGNAAEVVTGDAETDKISFKLLHADPDGDGVNNLANGFNDISGNIVSTATYTMTGNEGAEEILTIELDFPVTLTPNSFYYNYFAYDGTLAGTSISPRFLTSNGVAYANWNDIGVVTPLDLDAFYTGWNGETVLNRLHLDGFTEPVNVKEPLAKDQVAVFPSPATEIINMDIQLDGVTPTAYVKIADFNGRTVRTETIQDMTSGIYGFDVSELVTGTYFLTVYTDEGFRAKHFVVAR